jgi:hypothetical protein
MKIFDCHSHWATKDHCVLRTDEDWLHAKTVWGVDRVEISDEEQADYFIRNNARAIMDLSYTKELPIEEMRLHHDYALDFQRRFPAAIFGHWLQFQPWRAEESLAEFERVRAAAPGFIGLCINGQSTGVPASDPAWEPFYRRALDHNLPVMILCGLTGVGQGHPGGKGIILDDGHPRHLDAVAARHPTLRVLAARPAYPWQDEMIAILLHKSNVSYELHGWGPRQFSPALKKDIGRRLQDRVMFGLDFPALRFEKVLEDWRTEGYSEEVLQKVLHDNAAAYFGSS